MTFIFKSPLGQKSPLLGGIERACVLLDRKLFWGTCTRFSLFLPREGLDSSGLVSSRRAWSTSSLVFENLFPFFPTLFSALTTACPFASPATVAFFFPRTIVRELWGLGAPSLPECSDSCYPTLRCTLRLLYFRGLPGLPFCRYEG